MPQQPKYLTTPQIDRVSLILSFSLCSIVNISVPVLSGWVVHTISLQFDVTDPLTIIHDDGHRYLVVPKFLSSEETNSLLTRSKELLDEFNIDDHPLVSR